MKKLLILLLLLPWQLFAAQDIYPFATASEEVRFTALTNQLRCLVCQNQNLAESNAPLATDLRNQIYRQVRAGQSDQQIIAYLVTRYGDFILYRPPLRWQTWVLWFGPFLFLLLGVSYLLHYLSRGKKP